MALVVDDRLVLEHIVGAVPPANEEVLTTYHWWWRLARALRADRGGRLSAVTRSLDPATSARIGHVVAELPDYVTIPDPRLSVDLAAVLAAEFGLNLLSAEALAVGLARGAALAVATDNPPLARAAAAVGVEYAIRA